MDNSIDTAIILNSVYDISFGIYNPNDYKVGPFAKASFHPSEDVLSDNRFARSLRAFIESDVLAQTGISFDKAIEMPSYKFKQLCDVAREIAEKKHNKTEAALKAVAAKSGLPSIK